MKYVLLFIISCLMFGSDSNIEKEYLLQGTWTLRQIQHPAGSTKTFAETEETLLRLYEGDSLFHQCWMTRTENGLTIRPIEDVQVSVVDKGHGEYVYIEGEDPHPLTVKDDSTIIIQQDGILYYWHRTDDIANEWSAEIKEIVATELQKGQEERQSYMLSRKERQQANVIHGFICSTIGIVVLLLLIARMAIDYRRDKRRLQLQLQQIQEVQQERPQVVRQAIESVETAYFASDEYQSLQRRIATGVILKENDWLTIESQIKKVYPGFCSQLQNLHPMSELEYQVCLLIKLRVAPSDMAVVLARDASTISTVRSRLYKKVFGQKGGAREWDEFILSIGT